MHRSSRNIAVFFVIGPIDVDVERVCGCLVLDFSLNPNVLTRFTIADCRSVKLCHYARIMYVI